MVSKLSEKSVVNYGHFDTLLVLTDQGLSLSSF